MATKKLTRGISKNFVDAFKESELYELYQKHKDELIIGVRINYLNLYFNCDSIAKITYKKGQICCEIDKYYIDGKHYKSKAKEKRFKIDPTLLCNHYSDIKKNSEKKATLEKKAQSKLVLLNNQNNDSNWFCYDVEWKKAFENKQEIEKAEFNPKFDIMAISKQKPHNVAIIELKYGSDAIGGKSGIYKHIEDFKKYQDKSYFNKKEIVNTIKSQEMLGVEIPNEILNIEENNISSFEFYVITLNNNAKTINASTPKQTMSGYLFNDKRWNCKKLAKKRVEFKFGDVTTLNNPIHVKFLFSKQTLPNLRITDILNFNNYEKQ
ncbi:MAG: hypothetical protein RBS77_05795 [Candidatus Moranbacteria bacterium]|jgi:hypothetical protein|nr:hypothetical protein [Candidatus Moranbacteria bacterium]